MSVIRVTSTIPVVCMRDFYRRRPHFVKGIREAFRHVGFVAITNTGVKKPLLNRLYARGKTFFRLPKYLKENISGASIGGERGYTGSSESPVGRDINQKDLKEFLHFGRKTGQYRNLWPKEVKLKKPVEELYSHLSDLVIPITTGIEEAIDAPPGTILKMVSQGDHLLRLVKYPGIIPRGVEGAAAHTDSNFFTLLPQASSEGLEVEIAKKWNQVIVPNGSVVVNVGTMLEHMTNGYFQAALHRVIKYQEGGPDRYSVAYFVHARENDPMTPLSCAIAKTGGIQRYPAATRQQLLNQRLFAMQRTTPKMDKEFLDSGGIQRWEGFITPSDPRTQMVLELEKVKRLLAQKFPKEYNLQDVSFRN
jgi:isopenicillin N synthase-like dioxygenase